MHLSKIICAALLAVALVPAGAAPYVQLLRYSAPVAAQWEALAPSSPFRIAQYRVPAAPGAGDAEVVVFFFGKGQGGTAEANIARWTSQFAGSDGKPPAAAVERFTVDTMPVTLAELRGAYTRTPAGAAPSPAKADQVLLSAIVESPEGNLIFQLHGDRATVLLHREAFLAMVRGVRADQRTAGGSRDLTSGAQPPTS